jgi:hypothetical protein
MLRAAYKTGYGALLGLLDSDKWTALKKLQPKRHPVHAAFQGHILWLNYYEEKQMLQACTLLKDLKDTSRLAQALAKLGIEARICTQKTGYRFVKLNGRNILKLAERCQESRREVKELAHKQNLQPREPVTRGLLELAENPPNPKLKARKRCALEAA